MANNDIDIEELLTPKYQKEMLVRGSRRVVSELLETIMREHNWYFQKAGGARDLEVTFQIGKQARELLQDNHPRINGWIGLLSIAGKQTLIRFYSSPSTLVELAKLSALSYESDTDFVRQVSDTIKDHFAKVDILKTPK